ncbi:TraB/GumN family protein [Aquabacterium sp.]|uniref:TraB/GumN family protein n=1 Tax=Aquabacterium sp. TaxID=1872578 RepID=UPI003784558A
MTGRNWWPIPESKRVAAAALLALLSAAAARAAEAPLPAAEAASAPVVAASAPLTTASAPAAMPPEADALPRVAAAPDADPLRFERGTLWRLHAPSGAVGHLLGTIHIGQPKELALPPPTWSLLQTANRLVVELAPGSVDLAELERLQRLPAGESLVRQLSPAELQRLHLRLSRAGLALRNPQLYRPWVLAQLLQSAAPLTLETLDDRLVWQAKQQRLPVQSLETLSEQFGAFDCIAPAEQLALLKDTLAMPDGFFESLNRDALALYRGQRTGELVTQMAARFPVSAQARDASARATQCIIGERNRRFAERLQPLLSDNGVFAAIGAAHLVGPGGVLARLAAAGFRIEAIGSPTLADPVTTGTTPEDK